MKNLLRILFISMLLVTISSCKKNPCKKMDCGHGTCTTGSCVCENGYDGANCATEKRAAFLGNWYGTLYTNGTPTAYVLNITQGDAINDIIINNLLSCPNGTNAPLNVTLNGNYVSSIKAVSCTASDIYTFTDIYNDVHVSGSSLSIKLRIDNVQNSQHIEGTLTR